ncbi:mitochondrial inner membrane protease subunit 2 isoform X1 [Erinaceus europaeus]|uniref:Mitochondrial inner membrane protease subunit n=1 Tax=Erinaceus europaeus TaxID=9365 RepID=A0ABM3XUB0_ERIEU|nr:mitochondrial inner membrane protease subunit 2 isoform X1 [Erinaceus europaeus]XP_060052411.1 mitochondrial inner membrane protease subunit 2 isoform X1 [Erinaceus europaeus]
MAQSQGWVRRYLKAFCKGFFVAVPVAVTFLDRVACVARVEGSSMQPSLNPGGSQSSDVVLLNHWKVRNFEVQRGDIVSLVSPKNPEQKIIKRVIALEGDIVKTIGHKNRYVKVPRGHIWVEGDHHGHSFDSNSFGPANLVLCDLLAQFKKRFPWDFYMLMLHISCGLQSAGRNWNLYFLQNACQFRVKRNDYISLNSTVGRKIKKRNPQRAKFPKR